MTTKSPDVLVAPPSPLTAITLAEMHVRGWRLKATCNRCTLKLRVGLPAMIRTYGPDAIWWGQSQRCPGLDCYDGKLTYAASSIGGGSWVAMTQPPGNMELTAHHQRQRHGRGAR